MKRLLRLAYRLLRVYWFVFRPVTLGVRVILVRKGRILLVRHSYQDAWYFPGGGVKKGELLEAAIRREAAEEAGVRLGKLALFGVYSSTWEHKNDQITIFTCAEFEQPRKGDAEIEAVQYFPLDELPADLSPGCRRRVQEYLAGACPNFGAW